MCDECQRQKTNTSEELYCICQTPYDDTLWVPRAIFNRCSLPDRVLSILMYSLSHQLYITPMDAVIPRIFQIGWPLRKSQFQVWTTRHAPSRSRLLVLCSKRPIMRSALNVSLRKTWMSDIESINQLFYLQTHNLNKCDISRLQTNLKLTVLSNTKLRHFWAQIVSWAPRHARKSFIVLAPYRTVATPHVLQWAQLFLRLAPTALHRMVATPHG